MKEIKHEYYVSFEVAKLLKEAGFKWKCRNLYDSQDNYNGITFTPSFENWNISNKSDYSAPTLDVAQRWLREVKGYELWVYPFSTHYRFSFYGYLANEDNNTNFDTYEEALEAGIKKALEIILEKRK